jgi:hypothetical protein
MKMVIMMLYLQALVIIWALFGTHGKLLGGESHSSARCFGMPDGVMLAAEVTARVDKAPRGIGSSVRMMTAMINKNNYKGVL